MGCSSSTDATAPTNAPTSKPGGSNKTFKFTYFPIGARGELSRWIFAVAKQPYTDDRVKWEDWPALKPTTPFGQLPLLTVGDVTLCQSNIIASYLARTFNLAGDSPLEQSKTAMIVMCVEDAYDKLTPLISEKDADKKAAIKKQYTDEKAPEFLKYFDELLKANGGGDGYFVGKKLTYADLALVVYLHESAEVFDVVVNIDNFPKLKELKTRVESDPGLAEWLKNRPASIFPPK